jgi:hypothetical protein
MQLLQFADYRNTLEEDNPPDEFFGVLHFGHSPLLDSVMQFSVSPVIALLGMHHVLVHH